MRFIGDNWMNGVLSRQQNHFAPATALVLFFMMVSSGTMIAAAGSAGGILVPGAAAATVYTVSTINNAFEATYSPFFGVLGSHMASFFTLIMVWMSITNAPSGSEQVFFIIASLSFFLEGFLSMASLYMGNKFGMVGYEETENDPYN